MFIKNIDLGSYDVTDGVHKITDYRCVSRDMQHTSLKPRLYLHLDMNCFYAQIEQQCYRLHGMPVYIGGWYKKDGTPRGIVATSSYEARAFGVKTGISAFEAEQLCPWAIGLQADYEKYSSISKLIEKTLKDFAPTVEKYSMDEYFLDINFLKGSSREEIRRYGEALRNLIYQEVDLVCSTGISYSKTYAKLTSDLHKPNGLALVLNGEDAEERLHSLSLDEVWGIGRKRYARLRSEGLSTIGEAIERGSGVFQKLFGAYFGQIVWEMVAGRDRARVLTEDEVMPEQLNYMHTFSDWCEDPEQIRGEIMKGVSQLCYRMRGYEVRARQFYGYLRIQDATHKGLSFRFNTDGYTNLDDYIFYECMRKATPRIRHLLDSGQTLRGIGLGTLKLDGTLQQELFFEEDEERRRLCLVQDAINNRYSKGTAVKASAMEGAPGKTHFLSRS